jgi:hypothetical protein
MHEPASLFSWVAAANVAEADAKARADLEAALVLAASPTV